MINILSFVQEIQQAYSRLTNLTLLIVDEKGNEITKITGENSFSNLVYHDFFKEQVLEGFLQPLSKIKQVVTLDTVLGPKMLVSPIYINEKLSYYILAGSIVEENSREFIKKNIMEQVENPDEYIQALDYSISNTTAKEISNKVDMVKKLTHIISSHLNSEFERKNSSQFLSKVNQNLDEIKTGVTTISSFIGGFDLSRTKIDFLGIAMEREEGQYYVEAIIGENTEAIKGYCFQLGEGFFGRTLVTETPQFWKNISNDPRVNIFTANGLEPKSLVCTPIFDNQRIKGVLFAGSNNEELDEEISYERSAIFANMLSLHLTIDQLKEEQQNHLMKLSTFNEIFRVITSVDDIKRVLYILVDISINLIRGSFSTIIFKPEQGESRVEIISRGLSSDQINDYCHDVALRAFSKDNSMDYDVRNPIQKSTSWGANVLEFPLVYNNQLYGVLCVAIQPKVDPENYKSFLSTLAIAGGIAIHLRLNQTGIGTENYKVNLLYKAMKGLNKDKFTFTTKVSELVENFSQTIKESFSKSLKDASLLVGYEFYFIKENVSDKKIIAILQGCNDLLQGNSTSHSEYSKESEILALIYYYVQKKEKIDETNKLVNISPAVRSQFKDFINKNNVLESEIVLNLDKKPDNIQNKETVIKEELNLSTRELEVLKLVLKGCSNNEIAQTLFISDHTVKNHMTKILNKVGASDRAQAIAKVYQMGYSSSM
ncbi:DNA-binding CsgD family transcriptional regulator/ligand-binding sensor protein [Evansella vedderi]|uniref:DNA-binding CsgD family transcriptional regulator/ligand-binding sensor protein n=1 Tax=Evansella vedderi TaxID=38282 RepID=A0ABT9ZWS5_9BACI|nr:LuxR C-terminal-related transcriptional regulator [Evansella vedderi]MDQ0255673.1 DNA-binding CsgD family transcriptional regulator/ligand-binding sensor protein [Evansella vedderi]